MNAETIAKLIVKVCEAIKERSGGTGLEARIADRVLAEVAPLLPRSARNARALPRRSQRRLPGSHRSLTAGGGGQPSTPDDGRPWLEAFLAHAEEQRWCTRLDCTTCGASVFRNELMKRAAQEASVNISPAALGRGESVAKHLSEDDFMLCAKTIAEGLASLPEPKRADFNMPASELILHDLRRSMWPFLGILETALEGSWAGRELKEIEEEQIARREWAETHRRRQKEERRLAAERKVKREAERKKAAQAHLDRKARREALRRAFLDELAALAPTARIERMLADDVELPIDAVPESLIPDGAELARFLEPDTRARLLETIGRRRGPWARLRKTLLATASAPEGSPS